MNGWAEAFAAYGEVILSRPELRAVGATDRMLTAAVRSGRLVRIRNGHYSLPQLDEAMSRAVRVGGRLACASALASYGVFAEPGGRTHVQLEPSASRHRGPQTPRHGFRDRDRRSVVLHWHGASAASDGLRGRVALGDALIEAFRCQPVHLAMASLDNALHLGLVGSDAVGEVFAALPARFAPYRPLVDGRAEAGQETVLRLLVHELGLPYEIQVVLHNGARVDILVAGCLVLEADSRAFHEGWPSQVRDRRRDLEAAIEHGYPTLRPVYEHTMREPELVKQAIVAMVRRLRGGA